MEWFRHLVQAGASISSDSSSYQLEKILGSGSFGTVALCRKNDSFQKVALKVAKKADNEAHFMRFLMLCGPASHYIVGRFNSFCFNDHFCHEYEALDISLEDFLYKSSTLPLHQIRPIISQMADAFRFLKSVKMIHGDLKPANIIMVDHVRKPLQVKIIDFGLACTADQAMQGVYFGTRSYSSPEMAIGAPIHHALDMWAVGCIAVEMFLGKLLFEAYNARDLITVIVQLLGLPPGHVLDSGLYSYKYFSKADGENWVHKMNPHGCRDLHLFVDLTKRLLDLDPDSRIDPQELMDHPFMNESSRTHVDPKPHLESQSSISPLQTSPQKRKREDGEECPGKRLKGEVIVISSTESSLGPGSFIPADAPIKSNHSATHPKQHLRSQSSISPSQTSPQKRKREDGEECPGKRIKGEVIVISSTESI